MRKKNDHCTDPRSGERKSEKRRKQRKIKQLVQKSWRRVSHLCTGHTKIPTTKEPPTRGWTARVSKVSRLRLLRKLVYLLKGCCKDLIHSDHTNVKGRALWFVRRKGGDRVIDMAWHVKLIAPNVATFMWEKYRENAVLKLTAMKKNISSTLNTKI